MADYLSCIKNGENANKGDDDFPDIGILRISSNDAETYKSSPNDKRLEDLSHFLSTGLPPPRMRSDEKKRLAVKSPNFCQLEGTLYHKGSDDNWRRCVCNDEEVVLQEAHCDIRRRHYAGNTTALKIWQGGLW